LAFNTIPIHVFQAKLRCRRSPPPGLLDHRASRFPELGASEIIISVVPTEDFSIRFEVPPVLRLDQPGNPIPVFLRDPLYPHVTWQVLKVHVVVRRKQFPTRHILLRSLSARSLLLVRTSSGALSATGTERKAV